MCYQAYQTLLELEKHSFPSGPHTLSLITTVCILLSKNQLVLFLPASSSSFFWVFVCLCLRVCVCDLSVSWGAIWKQQKCVVWSCCCVEWDGLSGWRSLCCDNLFFFLFVFFPDWIQVSSRKDARRLSLNQLKMEGRTNLSFICGNQFASFGPQICCS